MASFLVLVLISVQNTVPQTEASNLQQALCYNIYLGFVFAYESMIAAKVSLLLFYLVI